MNRSLSTLLLLAGIAGAYCVTLGRSHLREITDLQRDMASCYASFDAAENETTQVAALKQSVQDLDLCEKDLRQRLTRDPLAPSGLATSRAALEAAGLLIERADPMTPAGDLALPHERSRIIAVGPFGALYSAIAGIENDAIPTRVTDLAVQTSPDPALVRAEITIVRAWSIDR